MAIETFFVPDATLAHTWNVYVAPSTRPATFCWRTGEVVLAAIWSAVVLPSGAAAAFALTAQEPPFLSHVPTLKSSEYFAMFSYGPPADWKGPHSTELRCESRYAQRLLA